MTKTIGATLLGVLVTTTACGSAGQDRGPYENVGASPAELQQAADIEARFKTDIDREVTSVQGGTVTKEEANARIAQALEREQKVLDQARVAHTATLAAEQPRSATGQTTRDDLGATKGDAP